MSTGKHCDVIKIVSFVRLTCDDNSVANIAIRKIIAYYNTKQFNVYLFLLYESM